MKYNYLLTLFALTLLTLSSAIFAQGTPLERSISYQGRLDIDGAAAQGSFDFRAVLFDAIEFGNQSSPVLNIDDITVNSGLVDLTLNFGADVFTGSERYLQLEVRPSNSNESYTRLEPRQRISAAPYSLQSLDSINATSALTINGEILQRGLIGDCLSAGSAGTNGTVDFSIPFSQSPSIFLTVDESFNGRGCITARVRQKDSLGFTWQSFSVNDDPISTTCDCIHWLAIGPPESP